MTVALFVQGRLLGVLGAKKQGVGTQDVLEQAKRYARGIAPYVGQWGEYFVLFLYSTNKREDGYKAAKQHLDAMPSTVLAKAFAGEVAEQVQSVDQVLSIKVVNT